MNRKAIRNLVACPYCKQPKGSPCLHRGKGASKKMRNGVSHWERMTAAQRLKQEEVHESLIDEEDTI